MQSRDPIHVLRRKAKLLSRHRFLPLHAALDAIAAEEGYRTWSLLVSRCGQQQKPAVQFLRALKPGDLALIAARPRQGKTLMGLEMLMASASAGRSCAFFTLEYTTRDVIDRLQALGADFERLNDALRVDCSDTIDAEHIMETLSCSSAGTVAVVDYLQLLDQKRDREPLATQVTALRSFARSRGLALVFLSQIDRSYDASVKPLPDAQDIRLPNPLDLGLFDWMCFLQNGDMSISRTGTDRR